MKIAFPLAFLLMILVATFALGSQIKPVRASGPTIYIMSDGNIQGTSSIHTSDNVTYVFTADIVNQSVVVQRSNIVINGEGHTLQVSQDKGFYVAYVSHVTIRNVTMSDSYYGIYLFRSSGDVLADNRISANYYDGIKLDTSCSNNTLSGNQVTANNEYGVFLYFSSGNNTVSSNNVTATGNSGIFLDYSSDNAVSGNNVTANSGGGISLVSSSGNVLTGNSVSGTLSGEGITLVSSSGNKIFHNDFSNTQQTYIYNSTDIWDNGYPSGGNYWSDYVTKYTGAAENDSSGIWNTPYVIDANNVDNQPFVNPNHPIIPEFQQFLILPLFMITMLLAVIVCRRKHGAD